MTVGRTLSGSRRSVLFNLSEGSEQDRNATVLAVGLQGLDALGVPLSDLGTATVWRSGLDTTFGATAIATAAALLVSLLGVTAASPLVARAASLASI